MGQFWERGQLILEILRGWPLRLLDGVLVVLLVYTILVLIGERRTLWMVRGFIVLLLASTISRNVGLALLAFVLDKLVIGSAVAMAFILQGEFRRLLEQIGRGRLGQLLVIADREMMTSQPDNVIDELVDAIKELSQNRIGALIIVETDRPIDERDFSVPGVKLNAEVSRELLQTIFQTSTLLHDGAVLVRGTRVVAAGVILPISERSASRQLGTRHRAAMGITERVEDCICLVVSEETGSISVAEGGRLIRPLTSSKLRELLSARLSLSADRDSVTPQLRSLSKRLRSQGRSLLQRLPFFSSSASRGKK
ncbi:diadenylate cyclase CdaA [Oscillatoria sp. CS-180]|uniref:diadenylate cyclase CdaA n=1 Tax=Oscillatoria sp. CS-180 TaxID=3021720 RepID=UPI00232B06AF|nr:diadenylate cyclase CdaA [Oscillatoria sp. CS-180]MDB9525009.1 diadenylate cyclase CdaA [Oscillatoria sp. CS-180]